MRHAVPGVFLLTSGGLLFFSAAFALQGTSSRLFGFAGAALLALVGGRMYGNPWATMSAPLKETWTPRRRSTFILTAVLTPVAAFATVVSGLISGGLTPVVIAFLLVTALSFAVLLLLPVLQKGPKQTGHAAEAYQARRERPTRQGQMHTHMPLIASVESWPNLCPPDN